MEDSEWTIQLPETAKAWGRGLENDEIAEILVEELDPVASELTDGACANSGGWPDDAQVHLERLDITAHLLTAQLTVHFIETIASGCKDMPHLFDRVRRLTMRMTPGATAAVVAPSRMDPAQWDLVDRNSAADGT